MPYRPAKPYPPVDLQYLLPHQSAIVSKERRNATMHRCHYTGSYLHPGIAVSTGGHTGAIGSCGLGSTAAGLGTLWECMETH